MPATIIDGKAVAASIRQDAAAKAARFKEEYGREPGLAVVIVGDNPASRVYVNSKKKACAQCGIYSEEHALPADVTEGETLDLVRRLNGDPNIDGVLVQLPLPEHISEDKIIETIAPSKDVDGFHPINVGNLVVGKPALRPCTPAGIMELIHRTGIALKGKHAVVVGRSNIVGKPVALMLLAEHATVTICHSRTQDLPAVCRSADVLVAAVGRPQMIKGDWIKPGAVVIDVGVNRIAEKKLVGDVDFAGASAVAAAITPVPGGVGPMTIAMLMHNCVQAAFAAQQ
ncbi:MAG TPA: bifunctional methylenetetrahydrofolate dehydrogenase/methenyltetrahydrofolate cyclohydrolase FolD [Firmicutes bacterium]|jgi:methylenetetrahydrofolate dehydrogenase (NADP+)/methenyltetrahydrofolate cyclohydrolase|nr:bifunctional methylenetetrahydrofolate dehydrogenase/methenyltetrahydrofolate cyclohydrolase FolD [Bacillota bacterium]